MIESCSPPVRDNLCRSNIIEYQLRRAVSSGQNISFVAIALAPEVESVLAALDKVYADKQVVAELQIDSSLSLFADEGDLAEVLGNILDNAYKHCQKDLGSLLSL